MRIALAQINPTLGDFENNSDKIAAFTKRALEKRADLVVFSELALSGYPPNDILERPEFFNGQEKVLKSLIKKLPKNITVIFGAIIPTPNRKNGQRLYQNAAVVVLPNKTVRFVAKQLLPTYDIFDESRFFERGTKTETVIIPKIGKTVITVCEDMWESLYPCNVMAGVKGVKLAVNISASPFSKNKMERRFNEVRFHIKNLKVPFVYVNQIAGQDEIIFDGRSFILDSKGKVVALAAAFEEDLMMADLATKRSEHRPPHEEPIEILRQALVLGMRDFARKTGHTKIHLGISGGIDSAVVASLAVDALGPGQVTGLLLPGPFSSQGSIDDSLELAKNLGIKTHTVSITEMYEQGLKSLSEFSSLVEPDFTGQNLQARLRGMILMGFANRTGSLLVSTSNKSELASGYSTLYGDVCGGLMPVGDLLKKEIYALAEHYNKSRELIPQAIINKAPSAELAPNQKDQDSLPAYDVLDGAVQKLVEEKKEAKTATEKWLARALMKSEFKRWQAPPILRVSNHAFGRGRRMPIAVKA